ncbi:hypothetical protein BS78_01G184500 [Paspalum vaginatum]|nr:hypothetical protein BS78_01G184500 [Paspalum vaginatum]
MGTKGGSTSSEKDYGGGGGGVVWLFAGEIVINGTVLADGDVGTKGGGGSGGSIYLKAAAINDKEGMLRMCQETSFEAGEEARLGTIMIVIREELSGGHLRMQEWLKVNTDGSFVQQTLEPWHRTVGLK